MPVYDYKCSKHGVFYGLATMEDSDKPTQCSTCGELSARIIRVPPEILSMPSEKRQAHERNEKSQHEPEFSTKQRRSDDEKHKHDCGCQSKRGRKLFYTAEGNKMFPSMRPWMISH